MKRYIYRFIPVLLICSLHLVSCIEENDPVDTTFSGFMTGFTDSEGYINLIKDDFGNSYTVDEKKDKLRPDTAYRLVASINYTEDMKATFDQKVFPESYVAPIDSLLNDTLRVTDPIKIESVYIGGGYLNVNVAIKVKKENTRHIIFYARRGSKERLEFTFYHNAYGDGEIYTKHAYFSIPLYGYNPAKNDTVFLKCKGYQEDYDYKLIYR
jgi:hypothetical protein